MSSHRYYIVFIDDFSQVSWVYLFKDCGHIFDVLKSFITEIKNQFDIEVVKHAARIGAELGADIIKTNYTGNPDTFGEVIKGCPVPVVMAGGPKTKTDEEFCKMVYDSIQVGGAGIAAGRNVFQHEHPTKMVKVLCGIVQEGLEVKTALSRYIK